MMIRRLYLVPAVLVLFLVNGCIKESYDMVKLSEKMQISPTLIIPAFTGSVTFSDLVEYDDTVLLADEDFMIADTTNNFLSELFDGGIKPEDIQFLELTVKAANGFPLNASLKVSLFDSATGTVRSAIDAPGILEAAPVNNEGKVTGKTETITTIDFSRGFLNNISSADRIIFSFKINTPGNEDVRIFSDYRIDFSAAITVKPDIDPKTL